MNRMTASIIIGLASCLATGLAQTETGLIAGTITDPSGAFVVGANVAVRSLDTQATRSTVTTATGLYTVPNLQPGNYEVVVEAKGFARFTQRAEVTVGSRSSVDASLAVGGEKTSVEVRGKGGVQVETQTQTLSEVVTGTQITELPTLTRNPYDLVQLSGNISPEDPTHRGVGVAINGQRAAGTNVQLDGAENMDEYGAFVGQSVPLDAVQEFRLLVSNFTAEYGRASGGIVNVATKSGTNALHGTIYEFNRVKQNSFKMAWRAFRSPL